MHLDADLWTYDSPLKERQNVVTVLTTKDLIELLKKGKPNEQNHI